MWKKSEKGQTLIEAVVTLGVALVIIGSIVALANASNRRATLARQSTQASKLAEEGMEIIRNIRDVNYEEAVFVGGTCSDLDPCSWSDLYGEEIGVFSPVNAKLLEVDTGDCGNDESWCLGVQDPGDPADDEILLGFYHRSVEVSDQSTVPGGDICATPDSGDSLDFTDIKRITVTVTWRSPIGNQKRTVVSCLSKWE